MKADSIVVLQKGKVVQQGTHGGLLESRDGPYWALVNAQQLANGNNSTVISDTPLSNAASKEMYSPIDERFNSVDLETARSDLSITKPVSSFGSFSLFFWEQKHQWVWYSLMLLGCLGAGGKNVFPILQNRVLTSQNSAAFPLHSFLFAKLISIFNLWGKSLQEQTNFWCLMFTFLALGVGASYFLLGWSSNIVSFVSFYLGFSEAMGYAD